MFYHPSGNAGCFQSSRRMKLPRFDATSIWHDFERAGSLVNANLIASTSALPSTRTFLLKYRRPIKRLANCYFFFLYLFPAFFLPAIARRDWNVILLEISFLLWRSSFKRSDVWLFFRLMKIRRCSFFAVDCETDSKSEFLFMSPLSRTLIRVSINLIDRITRVSNEFSVKILSILLC